MCGPVRPGALAPGDGSIPALKRELAAAPGNGELAQRLALVLLQQGRFTEARELAERLAVGNPAAEEARFLQAWAALGEGAAGVPERIRGLPREAAMALDLAPRAADLGRWNTACALLARAAELLPGNGEVALKQAAALDYAGRFQAAEALLGALAARYRSDPRTLAGIRFHQAHSRLLQGDLAAGFRLMEARLELAAPRTMPLPRWQGGPLAGRKLLLRAEQGYGDLFMFVRYAPLLAGLGAEVYLEPFFSAQGVLGTCPGVRAILEGRVQVPGDMLQVELLSLPLRLGTDLASVPADLPYLSVPAAVPNRAALAAAIQGPGRRLGLVWSGNPGHVRTHERNIDPEILELLAAVPGVSWFSLQKGDHRAPALPMIDLAPLLSDYSDTAFALSRLDGLISVDTGIVHLAGAMAVPTWVLLAKLPDWRWMLDREDSPWYPGMRLWRQEAHWDWPGVMERLVAALADPAQLPRRCD